MRAKSNAIDGRNAPRQSELRRDKCWRKKMPGARPGIFIRL
jgi:hypothetical protein